MPDNLSDALSAAKKDRKVLSKLIIWESGVSKSQFYRIINGKEAPSFESKRRISESLGIDCDQFDLLHSRSEPEHDKKNSLSGRKPSWSLALLALSVFLIGLAVLLLNRTEPQGNLTVSENVASQDDGTLFIKDVTIPDGTSIPVNTSFEKTWRVKNTGKLVWKDRYLMRMTPASELICSSPTMVPIPETLPGQTVDISVTFMTPHLPGSCRTDWKDADDRGNLYFPGMHGLFSIVTVVAD